MGFKIHEVRLGDICAFRAGSAFPRDNQGKTKGDHPFIKVSDMNAPENSWIISRANNWISSSEAHDLKAKLQPKGATVFAKIGEALKADRTRLLSRPTLIDNNMMAAVPKESIDPLYLYYLITSLKLSKWAEGSALPYLKQKVLGDIVVRIPVHVEDQQRTSSILELIDRKIRINQRTNDYLAELIDALFCELVLGALDLSNTVQFSSVLSERKEKCLSRTNPEYSVTDTGIHPRDSKFHKNLSAATSKNKILRKDDLVFGISRKILNWGLFEDEIGEVSSAYRVYSIRSLPPEYVARYIAHYQHAFTDIIKPSSREGQGIMPDALMAKTIPVLDKEAWNRYVQAVESIKEQIRIVADESEALAELRDTLLPKLMSGEIDVSKVDLTQPNNHLYVD